MTRRHELTDAQWDAIKDLIPGKLGDPGRSGDDNRRFVNAVLFVLKTGIPWDDLPARYGKPNSIWKRFDRWSAKGVWEEVFRSIGEPELKDELQEVQIDSTSVKAHPVASTGRRQANEKKGTPTNDVVLAGPAAD
jgi:transposase